MEWCSHCLKFLETTLDGEFISCSTCGKVLGEVTARKNYNCKKIRFKRTTKTRTTRRTMIEVDPSCSALITSLDACEISKDGFHEALANNTTMEWCTHCLKFSETKLDGGFISCSTCGKVLGEVTGRKISTCKKIRFKTITKTRKTRPTMIKVDPSCSTLITSFDACEISQDGFHEASASSESIGD